ncbi:MAG: DUF374 domain-containing protein [Rickettsiales bacterium]|jgi:lysophospholipid acyltransferase (LPLAT)-like uncharacterized protein|nr:DUF374 domain-containing protein [Rickettsiales bacterium]
MIKKIFGLFQWLGIIQWIFAFLMFIGINFVYYTSKIKIENKKVFIKYRDKPAIFVFWHGRSMMLSPIVYKIGIRGYALAAKQKDGRQMAKLQRLFGLRAIYGSTGNKGAAAALRQGVRRLRSGAILALSPDGPRGPLMRLNDGALYYAYMTGAPIIPVCFSSSRAWMQNRWDRYLISLPFSRIICNVGNPVFIKKHNWEEQREALESFMIKQLQDTDAKFGLTPLQPANKKIKK